MSATRARSGGRILVVEDDLINLRLLTTLLRQEGYDVVTVQSGDEALEGVARLAPDAILLDVGLPDLSGIEVCRRLRGRTAAPVLFVSGRRDDADKVAALDAGGDDYIVKPFSGPELAARIRSALRRSRGATTTLPELIEGGGIVLDARARRVTVRGQETALTPREFKLLWLLMAHSGRALDREQIFDAVWGPDFVGDESALDVYIRQLRHKVEPSPGHPTLIQTVRGVGFRFAGSA